ncbi:MAG: cellulase family glycosylhydrolase [Anaerolineae bacterium]
MLVGIALIVSVPLSTADAFMGFAVTAPPFTSLTYGIQAFLWWDHGFAGRDMDWIKLMVFSHVKQTFAWEDIQPQRDVWSIDRADSLLNELEQRGLKVIARLSQTPEWARPSHPNGDFIDAPPDNLADFATFCGVLADRYRGRIAAYQVWNEPNLSREWGDQLPDAAGYVALLKACSDAIHAADPAAIVISAGLAPTGTYDDTATPDDVYLQAMYDAGFQRYVDAVGMHAPGYSMPDVPPEDGTGGHRFFTFRRIEDLRRIMVANGDAAHQVALLEVGWTTDQMNPNYAWFAVDEAEQARNLVAAYRYAAENWRPWVGLMSAIYIASPDWTPDDEEWWWAITTPQGYTRPAYVDLANMAKYCGERVIPARDPGSPEALGLVPVDPCD